MFETALAHELVVRPGEASPARWMVFLHGILGRRANWRSFARRWLETRPGWGAVLVDLRDHGESQGLPGPRTVSAAAADLVALAEQLTAQGARVGNAGRVAGILGHSFGGKVAISAAAQLRAAGHGLEELWVIDAPPGPRVDPRDRTTDQTFALLAALPEQFEGRSEFVQALIAGGLAKGVAQWLATNLVEITDPSASGQGSGPWRFGLDLAKVRALLQDFTVIDLWPALEAEAAAGTAVGLVLGGLSEAVFGEQRARADALAGAGVIAVEVIEGAKHWVHVDRPDALLAVLARAPQVPAQVQVQP